MGNKQMVERVTDPIEKLARDICWAGFADPKAVGCTKAAYWRRIHDAQRLSYVTEARRFAFLLPKMNVDVLNEIEAIRDAEFCIVTSDALDGG